MNDMMQEGLQQALALTVEMLDAATQDNWALVTELDAQRQVQLKRMHGTALGPQHRDALQALQVQNRAVLERVGQVRETVEEKLSQHRYNHRALRTYVASAR